MNGWWDCKALNTFFFRVREIFGRAGIRYGRSFILTTAASEDMEPPNSVELGSCSGEHDRSLFSTPPYSLNSHSAMTTQSSHPAPPASPPRVANVIYRSLESAVTNQCSRHHDNDVTVDRLERSAEDPPLRVRIAYPEHGQVTARIIIRQAGGNVYDVHCEVGEDISRRFTYSQPRRSGTTISRAPHLGQKLGAFLVEKLEQHLGRRLLSTAEQSTSS